jgi:hypothetical protein
MTFRMLMINKRYIYPIYRSEANQFYNIFSVTIRERFQPLVQALVAMIYPGLGPAIRKMNHISLRKEEQKEGEEERSLSQRKGR